MNTIYETNRLILRVCDKTDAPLVLNFYERNLTEFAQYEPLDEIQAQTLAFHENLLYYEQLAFLRQNLIRLFLFQKDNPMQIIGTISYRNILTSCYQSCQIGYKMDSSYRNLGFCKEAICCGNQIMFEELGLHRIEAIVLPDNAPSIQLMHSLGFAKEGLLHDKVMLHGLWRDHEKKKKIH